MEQQPVCASRRNRDLKFRQFQEYLLINKQPLYLLRYLITTYYQIPNALAASRNVEGYVGYPNIKFLMPSLVIYNQIMKKNNNNFYYVLAKTLLLQLHFLIIKQIIQNNAPTYTSCTYYRYVNFKNVKYYVGDLVQKASI